MDRRTFVAGAVGAGALVGAATPALARPALRRAALAPHSGRQVRLSGWLTPVDTPSRHVFTLAVERGAGDPGVTDAADWPDGLVRIYPADADRLRAQGMGRVELVGRLEVGAYDDIATGHAAGAVLWNARAV